MQDDGITEFHADHARKYDIQCVGEGFIITCREWGNAFVHIPMAQVQYAHGIFIPEPANDNAKPAGKK